MTFRMRSTIVTCLLRSEAARLAAVSTSREAIPIGSIDSTARQTHKLSGRSEQIRTLRISLYFNFLSDQGHRDGSVLSLKGQPHLEDNCDDSRTRYAFSERQPRVPCYSGNQFLNRANSSSHEPADAFAKEVSLSFVAGRRFLLPPKHQPHNKRGRSS